MHSTPRAPGLPKRMASISSQLEWFVKGHGGTRTIHSVLVANNGIAAVKFIRSVRMWAFHQLGHERAITLVAMATPEDMRIDAVRGARFVSSLQQTPHNPAITSVFSIMHVINTQEHIRMADQFVEVPGGSNINNYANVRLIVATAQRTQVDAVWPGWCVTLCVLACPRQSIKVIFTLRHQNATCKRNMLRDTEQSYSTTLPHQGPCQ